MRVTKQLRTETAHRLTNYDGRCAHLHGHSYLWEVTVEGDPVHNGMVCDFKELKAAMNEVLDPWDHATIFHSEDPLLIEVAEDNGVLDQLGSGATPRVIAKLPPGANAEDPRLFIYPWNPTAENMAGHAAQGIQAALHSLLHHSGDVPRVVSVKCWETATSYAEWTTGDAYVR